MADETQLRSWMAEAEHALGRGQREQALELIARALATAPDNPDLLAAGGLLTLRAGSPAQARALIESAITRAPGNPRLRVNLAMVLRELGDQQAELHTLEAALALDPYFFTANLQKGSLFEIQGKPKQAANAYHDALSSLRPGAAIPGELRPILVHAQQTVRAQFRALEDWLSSRMAPIRAQHAGAGQDRVDDCLAAFLGRKRIYNSQPTMTHFPRLPAIPFFARSDFPWLAAVEAATQDIRQELLQALADLRDDFVPYVNHAPGSPLHQWQELNNSRRWSALFLYKDGTPQPQFIERCPRTVAALAQAPLLQIPGRAPTAFFSRLDPKTRIPPHTGSSNTRLTVHIPLIIPPGCGFRVGGEVREWQPGTALVFDDTIEHEAWNESDEQRVVLIFDIWNPLLTLAERDLMTVATAGIAEFFDAR
ncbi:MAG TPA: aspartyl/asparaginyl beta-hydroxylase domain-containing protein [Steroidobacteraceae bacterium]|nr:aspartyl/asparaginyl beta-hydroxylase domain-containing protein [Steroidobacteraceae bacterium]